MKLFFIAAKSACRKLSSRCITSSARLQGRSSVQEFGLAYLLNQKKSKRPLSPHLTIYKPQMTWTLSGLQRIFGCVMGGTLLIGGVGFAILPIDFTTFIEAIRSLDLPFIITDTFKFIIAFPLTYYTLNEIRMMGFELAKGIDLQSIYRSAYIVLVLSVVISLFIVINSKTQKKSDKLEM